MDKVDLVGADISLLKESYPLEEKMKKLISRDQEGSDILQAGKNWDEFDYKMGQEALDKLGNVSCIYYAGQFWKEFDYEKGLDTLIEKNKNGSLILSAGLSWKKFNHKKGLAALKNLKDRSLYHSALNDWPKSAKDTLIKIDKEMNSGTKVKDRKFSLKEGTDLDERMEALISRDQEGSAIYQAGKEWKEFDFKMGQEALSRVKNISFTYHAGGNWKEFDYKKGLDTLIKIDREKNLKGIWVFQAGLDWKELDFPKALAYLKSLSDNSYYKLALSGWPLSATEVLDKIDDEMKSSPKVKDKKFSLKEDAELDERMDFFLSRYKEKPRAIYQAGGSWDDFDYKKGLDALIKADGTGEWVLRAGRNWREFDFKKGLDALIEKKSDFIYMAGTDWKEFDYEKGLDALIRLDKSGKSIYWAGLSWKKFDYDKGKATLKKIDGELYKKALKDWPKSANEILDKIGKEMSTSTKVKDKKFSLKEDADKRDIYTLSAQYLHLAGINHKKFDFKKGLDALIKKDDSGKYIYAAGRDWREFDFDRGLDALIQKDKTGFNIFYSGRDWKEFDFEKGFEILVQKDKTGKHVYHAGLHWKEFDFKKGLAVLKKEFPGFYEKALNSWPKSANEILDKIGKEMSNSTKVKDKKFSLKEDTVLEDVMDELLSNATVEDIYIAGKYYERFDYERGLDALIEEDETGRYICWAGEEWKQFNFEKGFNALMKLDEPDSPIYQAGLSWKKFDYNKGLAFLKKTGGEYYKKALKNWPKTATEALDKINKDMSTNTKIKDKRFSLKEEVDIFQKKRAKTIFNMGRISINFDYKKGLDALIQKDKIGGWITSAGEYWKEFDSKKALDALIEVDKVGEWILRAGWFWEEFDYKKGFDALLKKDNTGKYIYRAGLTWKEFDYGKGLDFLNKTSQRIYYDDALKNWPKTATEVLDRIDKEMSTNTKIKDKKFSLKEDSTKWSTMEELVANDSDGSDICRAGITPFEEFDYKKGMEELLKKDTKGLYIFHAGMKWDKFDYSKGFEKLKELDTTLYKMALRNWPKTALETIDKISKELDSPEKKVRDKKFALKEDSADYKSMEELLKENPTGFRVEWVGSRGFPWFDYEVGLDLIMKERHGAENVYFAGMGWKKFNYKKALDFLKKEKPQKWYKDALRDWPKSATEALEKIEKDMTTNTKVKDKKFALKEELDMHNLMGMLKDYDGSSLFYAGLNWKGFDFKKGTELLLDVDKNGKSIYRAGLEWKWFDHIKGLERLKELSPELWYKRAMNEWPKTAKETLDKIGKDMATNTKMKDKKFSLKEGKSDEILATLSAEDVYDAGMRWDVFDFKKGLDLLIEKDKTGWWVWYAGANWREFDFEKGLEDIAKKNKDGEYVYIAGANWKNFDFKKGLDTLIKIDKTGRFIHLAGIHWKEYDYDKGLAVLKEISPDKWYKESKKKWPKTAKETLDKLNNEMKRNSKVKDKKFSLKEETYDLEKMKPFFDFAMNKVRKKLTLKMYNVSKYFKEQIPKGTPVKVYLTFKEINRNDGMKGYVTAYENLVLVHINVESFMSKFYVEHLEDMYDYILETLRHETIHILDYLRSAKPNDKKPVILFTVKNKKKYMKRDTQNLNPNKIEDAFSYINSIYEFNAAVHSIKEHKKHNTEFWKKFKNASEKEKVKMMVVDFFNTSNSVVELISKDLQASKLKIAEYASKDKRFVEKIMKRLHRESLLESNFKYRAQRYLEKG